MDLLSTGAAMSAKAFSPSWKRSGSAPGNDLMRVQSVGGAMAAAVHTSAHVACSTSKARAMIARHHDRMSRP